jgi:hypothetical protein
MKPEGATIKRFDAIILAVIVALVAGGAGFAVGHAMAPKAAATASAGSGSSGSNAFGPGSRRGGFGTRGTVSAVSGNTITVTTTTGATVMVDVTSATTYSNGDGSAATLSNVTTGTSIMAIGTNTSGTVAATRILINPAAPGSFGGSAGSSGSGSAPSN